MQIEDNTKKLTLNERINQIWSTEQGKTYTTAIATLVVVILMVVFAVVPAYMSITDQLALNTQKTKYLDDLDTKQQNLNTLTAQEETYSLPISLLNIYFQDKMNNELLIASFSQIAQNPDIKCVFVDAAFAPPAVTKKIKLINPNVKAVGFSAKFVCKIGVVNTVYKKIINLPVPIYIDGITYTNRKDEGGGGGSNYFYDMFAVTYTGEYYYWAGITDTTTN